MNETRKPRRLPLSEIARRKTPIYANEQAIKEIEDIILLKGKLIEKIVTGSGEDEVSEPIILGTTEKKIRTTLKKEAKGYLVLSQNEPATIYKVDFNFPPTLDEAVLKQQKQERENFIILKASATVTVKLWIF